MEALTTDRSAFLAERRKGIGGSDAPIILGLSSYKTPLSLWLEKTGRQEEQPDTPMLRRGRKLEAVVVSEYEEETGRKTRPADFLTHPKWPWMIVHLDRWVDDPKRGEPGVLEAKSANIFRTYDWQEEAPLPAQVQLMHAIEVSGVQWGSVAGLLGGLDFKYQDFERNEEFIAGLIEREAAFWRLVESDTPPEPTADDAQALGKLYAAVTGATVDLPDDAIAWDHQRLEASAEIKRLEELKNEAENKLRAAIGVAEIGVLPGGAGRYTWKLQHRAEHLVQASEFRVLRRAK